jgi:hypothetical protein
VTLREAFATAVKEQVFSSAVANAELLLRDPPGRAPAPALVALSDWFLNLDENERHKVLDVARMSADLAAFGMMCVIDGSRPALTDVDHIRLEAVGRAGERQEFFDGNYSLHEDYRAVVPPFGIE